MKISLTLPVLLLLNSVAGDEKHTMGMNMDPALKGLTPVETKTDIIVIPGSGEGESIDYYIKKKVYTLADETTKDVFELHGNCHAIGVDVSAWENGNKLTCDMGIYYEDAPTKVDWLSVFWTFDSLLATDYSNSFGCTDGISADP